MAAESAPDGGKTEEEVATATQFSDLSDELVSRLLEFVRPRDLGRFAAVSRRWNEVGEAVSDAYWEQQCHRRWRGKLGVPQQRGKLFLHADFSNETAARKLSVKQLKAVLGARRVNARGCFEKRELIDLVRRTRPRGFKPATTVQSPWKASFLGAEQDKYRETLQRRDLVSALWTLTMHGRGVMYRNRRSFLPDSSYDSIFTAPLNYQIEDLGRQVRIGPYPPLTPTRRRDTWGWTLRNQHVILEASVDAAYDGR